MKSTPRSGGRQAISHFQSHQTCHQLKTREIRTKHCRFKPNEIESIIMGLAGADWRFVWSTDKEQIYSKPSEIDQ